MTVANPHLFIMLTRVVALERNMIINQHCLKTHRFVRKRLPHHRLIVCCVSAVRNPPTQHGPDHETTHLNNREAACTRKHANELNEIKTTQASGKRQRKASRKKRGGGGELLIFPKIT